MEEYREFYRNKIIHITGGAGAIGSRLTRLLLELNCKIVLLDNLSSGYLWNVPRSNKILFIKGDITNDIDLKRIFHEKPDVIFHLAAFFANQNSVDYPEKDLKTNGLGTLKLLEHAELYGKIIRFIYASSGSSIYPSNVNKALTEDMMTLKLNTPYQITKMLGELYCNFYYKIKGIPIVNARIFNSYGPGEIPGQYRNVIPNFIFWSKLKKSLPITGTGEETRTFTFVDDICNGLIQLGFFDKVIGEAINIASGTEIKIKDVANLINKLTKNDKPLKFLPQRKWDVKKRIIVSNHKANELIGFKPSITFEDGIKKTIDWFDDNWNNIEKSADFPPGISSAINTR